MLHSATDAATDHEAVAGLHARLRNMEAIARETGVPSKNLWEARAKPNYKFRHGVYRRRVHALYTSMFAIPRFDAWSEARLDELREAFGRAVLPKSDPRSTTHALAGLIERHGPALRAADWARAGVGMRYLYASMLLAAERARLSPALVRAWLAADAGDAAAAAIAHFEAALAALADDGRSEASPIAREASDREASDEQRGLRARVLTARASAALWQRAKAGRAGAGMTEVLSRAELLELLGHHAATMAALPAKHPRAADAALLVVHIASALEDRAAALTGYARLVAERPAFGDLAYAEWSQIPDDPDLAFFRREVHPTLNVGAGDRP